MRPAGFSRASLSTSWAAASRLPSTRSTSSSRASRLASSPCAQPLAQPAGHLVHLDRPQHLGAAGLLHGREPGALVLLAPVLAEDQQQDVGRRIAAVGLQPVDAVLVGLARGDAQLDDAAAGEQRHRRAAGLHLGPVEARVDLEDFALAVAGSTRLGAQPIRRLDPQQGFAAGDQCDRRQIAASAGGRCAAEHQRRAESIRRRMDCTSSRCSSARISSSSFEVPCAWAVSNR